MHSIIKINKYKELCESKQQWYAQMTERFTLNQYEKRINIQSRSLKIKYEHTIDDNYSTVPLLLDWQTIIFNITICGLSILIGYITIKTIYTSIQNNTQIKSIFEYIVNTYKKRKKDIKLGLRKSEKPDPIEWNDMLDFLQDLKRAMDDLGAKPKPKATNAFWNFIKKVFF